MSDAGKQAGAGAGDGKGTGAGAGTAGSGKAGDQPGTGKGAAGGVVDKGAQGKAGDQGGKGAGAADGAKGTIIDGSQDDLRGAARGTEDGGTGGERKDANWPEDWRSQMAGGNEKLESLLKRYSSPSSVAAALDSLRTKLDSGNFKKPLAKDATADEIAAFRKDNGIPETWEEYDLPKGLEVAEADQPIVEAFLQHSHGKNYPPDLVQDMLSWYFAARQTENEHSYENDEAKRAEVEDAMMAKWGGDYRGNTNGLRAFFRGEGENALPGNVGPLIAGARAADGTLLLNHPDVIEYFANHMRDVAPNLISRGGGAEAGGKGVEDRIAEIEKVMRTDQAAYWKDEKLQQEYHKLLGVREKLAARDKARAAA